MEFKLKELKKFIFEICTKKMLVMWVTLITLSAIITPSCSFLFKRILNTFSNELAEIKTVIIVIVVYVLLQYMGEILENVQNYFGTKVFYSINQIMLKKMNEKLAKVKVEEYEKPDVYDLISRIKDKIDESPLTGAGSILGIFFSIISILTYIIMLGTIKWYYTPLIFILSVPYFLVVIKQGKRQYGSEVQYSRDKRKEDYINTQLTSRDVAKDIRFYHLLKYLNCKVQNIRIKIYQIIKKNMHTAIWENALTSVLKNMALIICIIISCYEQIVLGINKAGDILFIITAVQGIASRISIIVSDINAIQKFNYFLCDWSKYLELEEESCDNNEWIEKYTIEFEHVSFSYPNTHKNVLRDISFVIPEGKTAAIVGKNGSGKSTLISLILGLYSTTSGNIYIGNKNIEEVKNKLRNVSVCVFQDFVKYQMSLLDNLAAGNFGHENVDFEEAYGGIFGEKIGDSAKIMLGQIDEDGIEISGGEWQKIAIARGLYRENSKILIMDEPTANIDPEAESRIYNNFDKIHGNKTVLFVSHRVSLAKLCDIIIVLENGRVIEQGTHEDLLDIKGEYYEMYKEQSALYNIKKV